jgi:hypothetical protein
MWNVLDPICALAAGNKYCYMFLLEIFKLIWYVQCLILCGVPKTDMATTASVSLPTVGPL